MLTSMSLLDRGWITEPLVLRSRVLGVFLAVAALAASFGVAPFAAAGQPTPAPPAAPPTTATSPPEQPPPGSASQPAEPPPAQPAPPGPAQPPAPAGQPYPGQPYGAQPYPGQPYGPQPYGAQPYPGQPYPPYGAQPGAAPPYPGQPPQWPPTGAAPAAPAAPPAKRKPPAVVYDWDPDVPPPAGYELDSDANGDLIAAGVVLNVTSYLLAVLVGVAGSTVEEEEEDEPAYEQDSTTASDWSPLYIPVVGPFVAIETLDARGWGLGLLLANGIVQSAGIVSIVLGVVDRSHKVVAIGEEVAMEPLLGPDVAGLAIRGRLP
jgi:hypothetical protein